MITRTIKTEHYTAHLVAREDGVLVEKDVAFSLLQHAKLDPTIYASTMAEHVLAVENVKLVEVTAETYAISFDDFLALAHKIEKPAKNTNEE